MSSSFKSIIPSVVLFNTCTLIHIVLFRDRILREAQEQQRRAQLEYEEKNKLIITMQTQLREMQEFQQVGNTSSYNMSTINTL